MKLSSAILVIAILLFQSCRTIKHVEVTKTVVDSVAIHERDSLARVYRLDSAAWANERKILGETSIVFQPETRQPYPNEIDTTAINNTIFNGSWDASGVRNTSFGSEVEFYPNGTIKSAKGKIKSLNLKLEDWQKEAYNWKKSYDSLSQVKDSSVVNKTAQTDIRYVDKKTTFAPWWFWVLLIPAVLIGWYIRHKFK